MTTWRVQDKYSHISFGIGISLHEWTNKKTTLVDCRRFWVIALEMWSAWRASVEEQKLYLWYIRSTSPKCHDVNCYMKLFNNSALEVTWKTINNCVFFYFYIHIQNARSTNGNIISCQSTFGAVCTNHSMQRHKRHQWLIPKNKSMVLNQHFRASLVLKADLCIVVINPIVLTGLVQQRLQSSSAVYSQGGGCAVLNVCISFKSECLLWCRKVHSCDPAGPRTQRPTIASWQTNNRHKSLTRIPSPSRQLNLHRRTKTRWVMLSLVEQRSPMLNLILGQLNSCHCARAVVSRRLCDSARAFSGEASAPPPPTPA